jgi:hypothetical protein
VQSWHDDGSAKFDVLQRWAREFGRAQGRPPLMWIDMACIDQHNIEQSLALLRVQC